jgi:hypothetical protein
MKITKLLFTFMLSMQLLQGNAFAFGAIAVGDADLKAIDSSTEIHFIASGHDSPEVAETAAVNQCLAKGLQFCHAAAWYEGCGAYARSEKTSGTGSGSTEDEAKRLSLLSCGNGCKVVVAQCERSK